MKFLNRKAFVASIFGVVTLMGCGGPTSERVPTSDAMPATSIAATEVVQYISTVQASSSDSTEPIDISMVDMAADDTAEPGDV